MAQPKSTNTGVVKAECTECDWIQYRSLRTFSESQDKKERECPSCGKELRFGYFEKKMTCPTCKRTLKFGRKAIGKLTECPKCKHLVFIEPERYQITPKQDESATPLACESTSKPTEPQFASESTNTGSTLKPIPVNMLGFLIVVCFLFVIGGSLAQIGTHSTSESPPSPSTTPAYDPYKYDDATDRHLKSLPGMQGRSKYEQEEIIEGAKKFDAAVKELERQRGY